MTAAPKPQPGLETTGSVLGRMDLSSFAGMHMEYQVGKCRSCDEPAEERRLNRGSKPPGEWQRGECAMCETRRLAADEQERRQRRAEKALYAINVPPLYDSATLDTFIAHGTPEQMAKQQHALAFARKFVEDFGDDSLEPPFRPFGEAPPVTVFLGSPGTGKGHLAWSIAKAVATEYGASAMVVVLSDVIRDIREAWNKSDNDGPSEAERIRKYRGVDLLVIDEVSKHAFFGQPQQHLYDLVANREMHMRPTILTTNESGESLASVLGPALASRAAGWDAVIDFGTADYRMARRAMRREHLTPPKAIV